MFQKSLEMVLVLILPSVMSPEHLGSQKQKHQVSRVERVVRHRSRRIFKPLESISEISSLLNMWQIH